MRLELPIRHARIIAIAAAIVTTSVSAFGQSGQSRLTEIARSAATGLALQPGETLRAIGIEEAVKLGLEQNLGIQIQRYDPQIQDTAIAQARKIETIEELDTLQCEADDILRETLDCYDDGAIDESDIAAYSLVLDQFHHAVADRRAALGTPVTIQRMKAAE